MTQNLESDLKSPSSNGSSPLANKPAISESHSRSADNLHQDERRVVAYRQNGLTYPANAPFDPDQSFPEYPFTKNFDQTNQVYGAVRDVLHLAGLDETNYHTLGWNPLGDLVKPGGTVLIKPNWVRHYHLRGENIFSLITHPAILRVLIDYAFIAVGHHGRIWLMDAPLFDTDYEKLRENCQLDILESQLRDRGVPLVIADMRELVARQSQGVVLSRQIRSAWESEGIEFNLGADSEFAQLGSSLENVFGSDYDRRITSAYHTILPDGKYTNCYKIARRVLEADLVISLPKMKTHKKTGVSLNVKNMIGINTDKNYIPHYRVGSPSEDGDEFPDSPSMVIKIRRRFVRQAIDLLLGRLGSLGEKSTYLFMSIWMTIQRNRLEKKQGHRLDPIDIFYRTVQGDDQRTGNWWGNDTCWRSGLDINKILFYGDEHGGLNEKPQRQYFSLVDGVIAGEGDGPLAPTPRPAGVLIAGFDPISVDTVAIEVMGFNPILIRDIRQGIQLAKHKLTESDLPIRVISNQADWQGEIAPGSSLNLKPHFAWESYFR
jgi:uncharacterized protein (DUF362 family)